jgi:hypothetical protein
MNANEYGRGRSFHQRGVAAVELALMLPLLVTVLAGSVLCGRSFWHYTVAQKAAQDAARFMATVPQSDLRSPGAAEPSVQVARWIAASETADLAPGPLGAIDCVVSCDGGACGESADPKVVTVTMGIDLLDPVLPAWSGLRGLLHLSATAHLDHVAR